MVENTEFVDSGTLFVKEADISSGDWIDVAQQSNSSTAKVLSHSNTLIYRVPGVEAMMQNAVSTAEQFLSE